MGMVALTTRSLKTDFCWFGLAMVDESRHFAPPQAPTVH